MQLQCGVAVQYQVLNLNATGYTAKLQAFNNQEVNSLFLIVSLHTFTQEPKDSDTSCRLLCLEMRIAGSIMSEGIRCLMSVYSVVNQKAERFEAAT